jgi:DNA-directed RNA polymerase I subunit RPA1
MALIWYDQFSASAPKLLLVDVIERTCRMAVIHQVPNIARCMKIYDDKGVFTVSLPADVSALDPAPLHLAPR